MNPAIDLGTQVDTVDPERKLRCADLQIEPGGGGINVTRALRILGVEATAIFPRSGLTGKYHHRLLETEDVPCRPFDVGGNLSRFNFNVREAKNNRLFRFCTAGHHMDEREWQIALQTIEECLGADAILVLSGSLPPGAPDSFARDLATIVSRARAISIYDGPGSVLRSLRDKQVDWITPNLKEFGVIVGHSIEADALDDELEGFLAEKIVAKNVVVTLGPEGVLYAGKEGTWRLKPPTVEKRSAVGAGDSLVAGLALALASGKSHHEAVQWAVAAGTSAVTTSGSQLLDKEIFENLRKDLAACPE